MTADAPTTFDAYANLFDVHRREARRRAEWVVVIVMTPAGIDIDHLCNEAADHLADQIMLMLESCKDCPTIGETVLRRLETVIIEAFQERLSELTGSAQMAGRT